MGSFYTNLTLRGPSQADVAAALGGRDTIVTREENGCVVVADKACEDQDDRVLAELGYQLSRRFNCPVLAVLNHDDSFIIYKLFVGGGLMDEYNSSPDCLEGDDASEQSAGPAGGNAKRLCEAFGSRAVAKVEEVLRAPWGDYIFAAERHEALVNALGLPDFSVHAGYEYLSSGEIPSGLEEDGFSYTKDLPEPPHIKEEELAPKKILPGYYKVRVPKKSPADFTRWIPSAWMPAVWSEMQCAETDLSAECLRQIAPVRKQFREFDFSEVGFRKPNRVLNPNSLDSGGVHYSDAAGQVLGLVLFSLIRETGKETTRATLGIVLHAGMRYGSVAVTNIMNDVLESPPNVHILRVETNELTVLREKLWEYLKTIPEIPAVFENGEAMKSWFDRLQRETFEFRVRTGRFARMTDYEVEQAFSQLPPERQGGPVSH